MKTDAIVVKPSKIDRKGLFAVRDFKKGEVVTHWDTSHVVAKDQYNQLPPDIKEHTSNAGEDMYIIVQEPECFMNHSCEPNTYVDFARDIALRDIKKGEEITSDYSSDSVGELSFTCNCASKNCKVTIYL